MIVCKLCGKEFSTWFRFGLHLRLDHDMTTHAYYDKFFKKEDEGKCAICGKPTNFVDAVKGYRETCSPACRNTLRAQQMMGQTFKCECAECGKEFISNQDAGLIKKLGHHLNEIHNMSLKEYYDKYKKKEGEGICPICGKETQFLGYTAGYNPTCSFECANKLQKQNGTDQGSRDAKIIKQEAVSRQIRRDEAKRIQDYYKSMVDDDECNNFPEKEKVISEAWGALSKNPRRKLQDRIYTEVDTCNYDMHVEHESTSMNQRRRYSYLDEESTPASVEWL